MNRFWYKEFWFWFLIVVFIIIFIMGGVLLNFVIFIEDSLVVDDYYKEGKVINVCLDKEVIVCCMNIIIDLIIEDGSIVL